MAFAAVISLQTTKQNLKTSPRITLSPPSAEILDFAYQKLKALQQILKRLDQSSKADCRKKVNAVDARIKEAVWELEDKIESTVSDQILSQSQVPGCDINLQEIRSGVDDFIKSLKKMEEEYMYELDHPTPEEALDVAVSPTNDRSDVRKLKVFGLSNIWNEIKESLRFVDIWILGMAGIGKTTLAKEIFDDSLNFKTFGFECRAWFTVGRKCRLKELERDILLQLDSNMENILMEGEGRNDCSHYLKQILTAKRCLIVLDDVWDARVLDQLKISLPEKGAGSRFLFTSRIRDAANQPWHSLAYLKTMELLNRDESWDLLRERVFGEDVCPTELEKHGKKIAAKCDGLPLTIVTVANLLSQAEKTAEYWKEVAENKKSSIFIAAYDQTSEVLLPSYEYLPQHLKPLFLHMGVFPQNYEISKLSLFRMWIAECFLEPNEERIFEDSAQMYLKQLVSDNSVVLRCQISTKLDCDWAYDVKTCRLQSAFWHLCNREASKSKFFQVLTSQDDVFEQSLKNQRRLSFHNNILFAINDVHDSLLHSASTARSLLCFGPFYPYSVPICFGLTLLRVLDALQIRFYEFPLQVLQLVHLRYLALTYNGKLPASISKLWDLQVLIIYRYMSITKLCEAPSYVPIEIWDMHELKHIQIMGANLPITSSDTSLSNLLTLRGVSAQTCAPEVLEIIPNLRKLGIQIQLLPDDDMKDLHCLNHIDVLSKLSSLKCVVMNPKMRPDQIVIPPAPVSMFPSSLEKLHLSGMGYPWEYMSIIGSLPNLEVLKLRCYAFRGPRWVVKDDEFWSLKYLLVEGTDLVQFKVEFEGLGQLQRLCLKHCYKLKDIDEFGSISYCDIEVIDCNPSTVTFANEMRSKGHHATQISVHSSWEDGEAEARVNYESTTSSFDWKGRY